MSFLERFPESPGAVILNLAIILSAGFLMTRVTKRFRLPDVTGYILAGILIGPYVLHLIPLKIVSGMDFVTDIALAYIAFNVGKYFKLQQLKQNGKRIFVSTLFEALTAAAAVILAMIFIFRLPVSFALLLGAIGSATAPASTIMTIRQYHAKGEMVDTILQVVALDDAVALMAFSVCAVVAEELENGTGVQIMAVLQPLIFNILAPAAGASCGFLMKWIMTDRRTREHKLILVNAVIFFLTGICTLIDISPLLSCMVMGAVYINVMEDKRLFKQVNHFTPPIMLMFFVISGMRLDITMLAAAGVIGVGYFLVRIIGKYLGAYIGCQAAGSPKPIRTCLGMALVPQAGVSIGLAALGQRILPPKTGSMLSVIILSSSVLYEIVGPACAKASLFLSHTIEKTERGKKSGKNTEKIKDTVKSKEIIK